MMLTRCPGCETTFRIRSEQAKARQGKVRCGRCKQVFNAIDYMLDPASIAGPDVEDTPKVDRSTRPEPADRSYKADKPHKAASRIVETYANNDLMDDFSVLGDVAPPVRGKSRKEPVIAPSPLSDDYPEPEETFELRGPRRWPWVVGSLVTFLALTIQILITWRVELATRYPDLREPLGMLCEPLECTVGLPLNASLLKIESSDLHPSPQRKGRLELKGILKNHAPYAQTWPNLELTITDGSDRTLARRVLTPDIFVSPREMLAAGFPANEEFPVQVSIDVGDLPASGYRLYLFYP